MNRFHNFDNRMRTAAPPLSNCIAAIMAAVKGGTAEKCAVAVVAKPAAPAPLASNPNPAAPKASAPAKSTYVAKPLTPRLKAIRDEVMSEMAQEAKERRQAEIRASWDRARARLFGGLPDDRPDPHGWAAIHDKIRAQRAASRKSISI